MLRSLEAIVFEQATIDRVIQSVGVDARTARTAVLRGDNPRDIEVSPNPDCEVINAGRIMTMSANAVTHTSVEHIANSLETFGPELLCAYPSALETLARYLRDNGRRLSIPAVVTSSEVFRPEAWSLVEQMLGCRLADYYGQAERIAFASANAPGEYRFQHGYSRVEFIPYDGQIMPRDSQYRLYEIVGTSFWNSLLPIVRYRTGDLVRLPASWGERELEELSLGLRTFAGVLGRQQELMVCPTGGSHHRHRLRAARRPQRAPLPDRAGGHRRGAHPGPAHREFSTADAELLLANARARIPPEVNVTRGDRAAAGTHAARQDAAHRASAARPRCAAPPWRRAAVHAVTHAATWMVSAASQGDVGRRSGAPAGARPARAVAEVHVARIAAARRCRRATCVSCRRSSPSRPST